MLVMAGGSRGHFHDQRAVGGDFPDGTQVLHRLPADYHSMTKENVLGTVVRGAIAVATSVVIGARAGASLARKPLLVPVHQRHQPYGRVVR
jgi:hypothetical protein